MKSLTQIGVGGEGIITVNYKGGNIFRAYMPRAGHRATYMYICRNLGKLCMKRCYGSTEVDGVIKL